jgi:hypothetical protein
MTKLFNDMVLMVLWDLQISSTGKAEITDATQMTLFTAEGILGQKPEVAEEEFVIHHQLFFTLINGGC